MRHLPTLYGLHMAAVTKHRKLRGLEQHKCRVSQFRRLESKIKLSPGVSRATVSVLALGDNPSFQLQMAPRVPGWWKPNVHLCLCVAFAFCLCISNLPLVLLVKTPVIECGALNPGWSHLEVLKLITYTKTLFPNKVTFTSVRI